ncbi:MAG: exodeoxyribonuclease VII small subunit [Ignavibacteria bacterium]|nr:exodeoxyribonuclease VII small subunit [Ignavibacteria bacterium]MCC7159144.1 exodeoxyribonuclease VII small subunit [Ignavibacteria bacterium]
MKKAKQERSFEDSFKRLETILERLEGEDCSLEETINLYEEGLTLTKFCYDKLNNAELRIKEINKTTKGSAEIKEFKQ